MKKVEFIFLFRHMHLILLVVARFIGQSMQGAHGCPINGATTNSYYLRGIKCICLFLFLMGCSSRYGEEIPEIRYGEDLCSECHMTLMDAQFACAVITEEGEILKFDDIGCMALFEKKNQPKIEEAWVHEGLRRGWIERSKAYYVFDPALTTPMGSQLIALGSKESLQEYLKKNDTSQIGFGEIDEFLKKK